jgi:hypothetical protein
MSERSDKSKILEHNKNLKVYENFMWIEVHLVYELGYVTASVGSSLEAKACMSMFECRKYVENRI